MSTWTHFKVTKANDQISVASVTHPVLLDNEAIERFRLELLAIIVEATSDNLLVDFARVTRTSTAVINSLLVAKKKLLGSGGDLFLCGLQDAVRHNFRILNLEGTVFEVFECKELALEELALRSSPH